MELELLAKQIPLFYIIGMVFYGIIFSFREISIRIVPERRFSAIAVLLLLNLLLGNIIFLLIGTYGAAYTMTLKELEKKDG